MDIHCSIDLEWNSSRNVGSILTPAANLPYSAPGLTGSGVDGPSPETLLIAAVSSDYNITLSNILRAAGLPQTRISVNADGVIVSNFDRTQFSNVTVTATIGGADVQRPDAYEKAAIAARDDCLVGRSIRGNVAFLVGEVVLLPVAEQ
jgi:organic hydroperoxide reductase OsmC/OhrA